MNGIDDLGKIIDEQFDAPILYEPAKTYHSMRIITGFTDCERISTHMITLCDGIKSKKYNKMSVEIILGMTKSSLSQKKHEDICRLITYLNSTRGMPKVTCNYICTGKEVHSKMYIWGDYVSYSKETGRERFSPSLAFCGSLNYTMNAFYRRRESVTVCDPFRAAKYYDELYKDTLSCFDPDVASKIKKVSNGKAGDAELLMDETDEYEYYDAISPIDTLDVSLLRADGSDTGYGSGINWGIRKNGTKRNPNQAYIPYNKNDKKEGFFPDRINPEDENCPIFKVITKDYGSFHMRMAQETNKALQSAESNAILGEWIRKRLGVPSGGYVTKQMLEHYGRTYVRFRKYADGIYLLDF